MPVYYEYECKGCGQKEAFPQGLSVAALEAKRVSFLAAHLEHFSKEEREKGVGRPPVRRSRLRRLKTGEPRRGGIARAP